MFLRYIVGYALGYPVSSSLLLFLFLFSRKWLIAIGIKKMESENIFIKTVFTLIYRISFFVREEITTLIVIWIILPHGSLIVNHNILNEIRKEEVPESVVTRYEEVINLRDLPPEIFEIEKRNLIAKDSAEMIDKKKRSVTTKTFYGKGPAYIDKETFEERLEKIRKNEKEVIVSIRFKYSRLSEFPDFFWRYEKIETIDFSYNHLETVPTEKLKELKELKELDIRFNRLSEEEKERVKEELSHIELRI